MKTKAGTMLMSLLVLPIQPDAAVSNGPLSYLIGGIIALLILGYLIYTLLRPDKVLNSQKTEDRSPKKEK